MNELFEMYEKTFGEPFPKYLTIGMSDEDIQDAIENCLVTGNPFEPGVPGGALI